MERVFALTFRYIIALSVLSEGVNRHEILHIPRRPRRRAPAGRLWLGAVRALRTFLRLPPATQALVLEAALALLLAQLLIGYVPMRHWRRFLQAGEDAGFDARAGGDLPRTLAWAVRKLARRSPLRARCLAQAMAVQLMLRRRSIASQIVFGVRQAEAPLRKLDFHAWLTVGGECVIGGREMGSFTALSPPP